MKGTLAIGEPAPWFVGNAIGGSPRYAFNTVGGRWAVMLFAGRASQPEVQAALQQVADNRALFDDTNAAFFGVTTDPEDALAGRAAQELPGIRWFADYDRAISRLYGATATDAANAAYTPGWIVLDPMMRVRLQAPLGAGADVMTALRNATGHTFSLPAPVLLVPDVLPVQACRDMIALYERNGGAESGFMREIDGVSTLVVDPSHKRRSDCLIEDEQLIGYLRHRVARVLRPMVERAFQFRTTRIERFIVAKYDAGTGGYFNRHRDNTTKATEHRKFAVTINLDAGSYEGGDLCFPEFGPRTYRAPTGGAVVFSCSLLHEAQPVTRGTRYAFLPFLYDEEGARLREANLDQVSPELRDYRSGLEPQLEAGRG